MPPPPTPRCKPPFAGPGINKRAMDRSMRIKPASNALNLSRRILHKSIVRSKRAELLQSNNLDLAKKVSMLQSELSAQSQSLRRAAAESVELRMKMVRLHPFVENHEKFKDFLISLKEHSTAIMEHCMSSFDVISSISELLNFPSTSPKSGLTDIVRSSDIDVCDRDSMSLSPIRLPKSTITFTSPEATVEMECIRNSPVVPLHDLVNSRPTADVYDLNETQNISVLPSTLDEFREEQKQISNKKTISQEQSVVLPLIKVEVMDLKENSAPSQISSGKKPNMSKQSCLTKKPSTVVASKVPVKRKRVRVLEDISVISNTPKRQQISPQKAPPTKLSEVSPQTSLATVPKNAISEDVAATERPRRRTGPCVVYTLPGVNTKLRQGDQFWCRK